MKYYVHIYRSLHFTSPWKSIGLPADYFSESTDACDIFLPQHRRYQIFSSKKEKRERQREREEGERERGREGEKKETDTLQSRNIVNILVTPARITYVSVSWPSIFYSTRTFAYANWMTMTKRGGFRSRRGGDSFLVRASLSKRKRAGK